MSKPIKPDQEIQICVDEDGIYDFYSSSENKENWGSYEDPFQRINSIVFPSRRTGSL